MKENYFLDDGAYLVTKIIIKAVQLRNEGKNLESLIADLKEPVESKEIRINIKEKDFRKYGEKVISDLYKYAASHKEFKVADDNYEGIRVSFDEKNGNGWFLLRLSVHDPIMPLNIESDSEGGVDKIYTKIKPFLEDCEGLDTYVKKAVSKTENKKSTSNKKSDNKKPVTEKKVEVETPVVEKKVEVETPVAETKTEAEVPVAEKKTKTTAKKTPTSKNHHNRRKKNN